ncbi:MAG: hypothetical protein J5I47_08570 [Vicingus serpentipes]|nr:hypothetical protein [Vicingus serpentipes]
MKISRNRYIIYALLLSVLFALGTYYKYASHHELLPVGCDEFGYMNMAKAFDKGNVFEDHAPRPFLKGLINKLDQEGISKHEYIWMLIPHAYHIPFNTKVINQYPPGTSYVLSWVPIELRKKSFPGLVILFTFLLPFLLLIKYTKARPFELLILLSLFVLILSLSTPFNTELARINSLALTFGLLIGAGAVAKKNPLVALFCIVLSANFRVVNLLMLFPLILFFIPIIWQFIKIKKWRGLIVFIAKSIGVFLLAFSPYLIYSFNLLGNPLIPTHPIHDTAFGGLTSFYFSFDEHWFRVHLLIITLLAVLLFFKKITLKEFLIWILFPVVNYLFFSFHKIQMSYYPFASFFILLGGFIYEISTTQLIKQPKNIFLILPLFISLVVCMDGVNRFSRKEHISFKESNTIYQPLCEYDVVWGEMLSGTAEYACNNNGFKYNYGTPAAREITYRYLIENNYSQAILCDDSIKKKESIKKELISFGIKFQEKGFKGLGKVFIIKGNNGI